MRIKRTKHNVKIEMSISEWSHIWNILDDIARKLDDKTYFELITKKFNLMQSDPYIVKNFVYGLGMKKGHINVLDPFRLERLEMRK